MSYALGYDCRVTSRSQPEDMKAPRWTAVSQSTFEWEREALDFLRDNLPDHEPWRAWSNFDFVDDEGRVNESMP